MDVAFRDGGRFCDSWRKRQFTWMPEIVHAASITRHACVTHLGLAAAESIRPLSARRYSRRDRLTGLMTPDNPDTADLPDAPYQGSVSVAWDVRTPSDTMSRLLAIIARLRPCARLVLSNAQGYSSLIGCGASSYASLTWVVGCRVDPRGHRHCCSRIALSKQHALHSDSDSLSFALVGNCVLLYVSKMNSEYPQVSDNMSSSSDSAEPSASNNLLMPDSPRSARLTGRTDGVAPRPALGVTWDHSGV